MISELAETALYGCRRIIVFRDQLLPPSETFIRAQGEAVRSFKVHYAGSRRVDGIVLPPERSLTIREEQRLGWVEEAAFKVLGAAPRFIRRLRAIQPILVHAHFGPDGLRALPLATALRVPLVVTFHGYDVTIRDEIARRGHWGHRRFVHKRDLLFQRADLLIAVSNFVSSRLIALGAPPERVRVHYIGVDTRYFSRDPHVLRERVVLFVGRLVPKKGCDHVIRAFSAVRNAFSDARLVVIGAGPQRAELERLSTNLRCPVEFLGAQPSEVVKAWMNRSQVLCVPSRTAATGDAEAFGMVFAEAQAMELPVVSYRSGGVAEAVEDGATGTLAPENDEAELTRALRHMLSDDQFRIAAAAAARRRVLRLFNLDTQTRALESLYMLIVNQANNNRQK